MRDPIFKRWAQSAALSKVTRQTGARHVVGERVWEDSSLDKMFWAPKPVYVGVPFLRKARAV